ncbi:hypothetical protein [Rufibacter tibetensis]|uniref:DUF5007 domain-containing protein n=1 Tax=Rufibacter tibetensis TaxID=512763 RepID=A0A0N7HWJ8_9BACT|nr:hypothetical protein [Rufibacter tibetensis]ALI99448.1 hypothetical protein DC20_11310 [Rufibacter tibetensis]
MKKLFQLLWLLTAPFLMSSCSEDDEPAPTPYSQLTSTVVYSRYTNNGYLPKDQPVTELRVYDGDTVRYNFRFETNQAFKDFKVYDNIRGRDFHLMGTPIITISNGVTVAEYNLVYVVDDAFIREIPNREIKLTVEPELADGTVYKDPATGKPMEIQFKVSDPYVYRGAKLYNYFGTSRNSLVIFDLGIAQHPRQALVDEKFLSPFAFLSNKMPPRDWTDSRFEHSFTSGPDMGEGKVTFVKVPAGAKNWNQPNLIATGMKQYGPWVSTVINAQVGDVYAFKVRYARQESWVIYGVMEVKAIVDDHDTSQGNGHDNDYMEFDIKYFPGYRY